MIKMADPWEEFVLPNTTDPDYGFQWPVGLNGETVSPVVKELYGFSLNRPSTDGFLTRYSHGLNLIRMLWPNQVRLYRVWKHWKTGERVIIWNNYFLKIFRKLCKGGRLGLAGCASSGKTFAASVYSILLFMSNPTNTTIMVSTTAVRDAENRVWGEIKALHDALPDEYRTGTLIDYLKIITFDPGLELRGKRDVAERDLRNGIFLVAIPPGSEGKKALGKIIGTKQPNGTIVWIIDELPEMMDGILRAESNLVTGCLHLQVIGIGNSNTKVDPHGQMCEPKGGYESVNEGMEEWEGFAKTSVLFLHGERSPNFHDAVNPNETDKENLPFHFLSSRINVDEIADLNGRGDRDRGRRTMDYMRFAIGFWYGDDICNTILTAQLVKELKADRPEPTWNHTPKVKICGFDTGWTSGGDKCVLYFATLGEDKDNKQALHLSKNTIAISAMTDDRVSFRKSVAAQVVEECKKQGVLPANFFMDINGDGGLMYADIAEAWDTHDCVGLSSLEPTEDDTKYNNVVTQYWFQVVLALSAGTVSGFDIASDYAQDLFARRYASIGQGKVKVENKKEMKKRTKHSPDDGDAFVYCIEGVKRRGFRLYVRGDQVVIGDEPSEGIHSPDDIQKLKLHERNNYAEMSAVMESDKYGEIGDEPQGPTSQPANRPTRQLSERSFSAARSVDRPALSAPKSFSG